MNNIVYPQSATVVKVRHYIQALFELEMCIVIIKGCGAKACLMSYPEFCTVGYIAIDHNIDGFTGVCIDTCGVIHITVCVNTEVACYFILYAIGLVHLHTETFGIVVRPALFPCDCVSFAPVATFYLEHHSLQHRREGEVIGIGLYLRHGFCRVG